MLNTNITDELPTIEEITFILPQFENDKTRRISNFDFNQPIANTANESFPFTLKNTTVQSPDFPDIEEVFPESLAENNIPQQHKKLHELIPLIENVRHLDFETLVLDVKLKRVYIEDEPKSVFDKFIEITIKPLSITGEIKELSKQREKTKLATINSSKLQTKPNNPVRGRPEIVQSQVQLLLNALTPSYGLPQLHDYSHSPFSLKTNILGTRYITYENEIIFFDSEEYKEQVYAFANDALGIELSDSAYKKALMILKGRKQLWTEDSENPGLLHIRIFNNGSDEIVYQNDQTSQISLSISYISSITNQPSRVLFPYEVLKPISLKPAPLPLNIYDPKALQALRDGSKGSCENLYNQLKLSCFRKEQYNLIITWMVYSLISKEYSLLELIGSESSGISQTQERLKSIIDPSWEPLRQPPKKTQDLIEASLEHYLLSFDRVDSITPQLQLEIEKILSSRGLRANLSTKRNVKNEWFIRRPIIINAAFPVATELGILKSSLSIFITKHPQDNQPILDEHINLARIELLRLAILSYRDLQTKGMQTLTDIGSTIPNKLTNFVETGIVIEKILGQEKGAFIRSLESTLKEKQLFEARKMATASLIYEWAKLNPNTEKEQSIKDWKITLSELDKESQSEFSNFTERKIGSEFATASDILAPLGIYCEPVRKSTHRIWKISTPLFGS